MRLSALAAALLFALLLAGPAPAADKARPAPKAGAKQEAVEVSGRVTAGLDQVFIKDPAQGYFLVQGANLAPYSGRLVQAAGVITATGPEYKTLRITSFRIQNPDDDGPGAAGTGREDSAKPSAKKKK